MVTPALQIDGLRGVLAAEALSQRRVELEVEGLRLRLSAAGATALLPPGVPLSVQELANGRIFLKGRFRIREGLPEVPADVEIRPVVLGGRLVLELVSVRAGFFPIPAFLVSTLIASRLEGKPGLRVREDGGLEVDLAQVAAMAGIALPALREVRVERGIAELEF
jgi:hypothetical protein